MCRIKLPFAGKFFALESVKMLGGSTMSAANALQSINSASMSTSALSTSYNSDRSSVQTGLDVEFASDAASGGFFNSDYKKCVYSVIQKKVQNNNNC